jgi:hypothetical protein
VKDLFERLQQYKSFDKIDGKDYLTTSALTEMARILPAFQVVVFQKKEPKKRSDYTAVFSALSLSCPDADILPLLHTENIKFDILQSKDEQRLITHKFKLNFSCISCNDFVCNVYLVTAPSIVV